MCASDKKIIISSLHSGKRLDIFLLGELKDKSRSSIQNLISSGEILINGQNVKSGYKLKEKDTLTIHIKEKIITHIQAENIPLNIVFEDEFLLVVNKPAGLVVHPGAGNKSGTLVNALQYISKNLSSLSGDTRPGIVHRLDKNTSGLLVVAKDDVTHRKLQKQFDSKDIKRIYNALVWGVPSQKHGVIESNITRSRHDRKKMTVSHSKGKEAITSYKLLKDFKYLSLLELNLKTGRTHQIRVHLNHINLPVFGDPVYNGRKSQLKRLPSHLQKRGASMLKNIERQALHAKKLSFIHPTKGKEMQFESDLPEDMQYILEKLESVLLLGN